MYKHLSRNSGAGKRRDGVRSDSHRNFHYSGETDRELTTIISSLQAWGTKTFYDKKVLLVTSSKEVVYIPYQTSSSSFVVRRRRRRLSSLLPFRSARIPLHEGLPERPGQFQRQRVASSSSQSQGLFLHRAARSVQPWTQNGDQRSTTKPTLSMHKGLL